MNTYSQSTGIWKDAAGVVIAVGHAGNGPGMNNPAMQFVHNVGPLPQGFYKIGAFATHAQLGPMSAPLTPQPKAVAGMEYAWLQGRGGFYLHGPEFSEGCIVLPPEAREQVAASADKDLQVIS